VKSGSKSGTNDPHIDTTPSQHRRTLNRFRSSLVLVVAEVAAREEVGNSPAVACPVWDSDGQLASVVAVVLAESYRQAWVVLLN
jgi:hypothetical protein